MSKDSKSPNIETYKKANGKSEVFTEKSGKESIVSKKRKVLLAEKIEIFERYFENNQELKGNTVFEDKPIGSWAIQIRSQINRLKNGKASKNTINPTPTQLDTLERLGILERQIDSTVDEKIQAMIEWKKRYPKATLDYEVDDEVLIEYVSTDKSLEQIQDEYEKMQNHYDYVRSRKSQGYLSTDQISRCKNGDVGGVFGYPTNVEELAKKYNLKEFEIDYLLKKYGTIEDFYEMYKTGKVKEVKDTKLAGKIIKDVVDIDGNSNSGYDNLYREIIKRATSFGKERSTVGLYLYSSEKLEDLINNLNLGKNNERDRLIVKEHFGIDYGTGATLTEISEKDGIDEIKIGQARIGQICDTAVGRLSYPVKTDENNFDILYAMKDSEFLTDDERNRIEELERDIQLQNGDLGEKLEEIRAIREQLMKREKDRNDSELRQMIMEGNIPTERLKDYSLEDLIALGLSPDIANKTLSAIEEETSKIHITPSLVKDNRTYHSLIDAKFYTLNDLSKIKKRVFIRTFNFTPKGIEKVELLMESYGIKFRDDSDVQEISEEVSSTKIEDLKIALPIKRTLKKVGINCLGDLSNFTEEDFKEIRSLQDKGRQIIYTIMYDKGIDFKYEKDEYADSVKDTGSLNPNDNVVADGHEEKSEGVGERVFTIDKVGQLARDKEVAKEYSNSDEIMKEYEKTQEPKETRENAAQETEPLSNE